jgi:predicted RNA-binding protein with PUA-like domain
MKKGDRVLFYHTGAVKAVVGIAKVMGAPGPDPADSSGRLFAVEIGFVKALESPVTLATIKADGRFADFPLVRMPRLSVMPVPDEIWDAIVGMARTAE